MGDAIAHLSRTDDADCLDFHALSFARVAPQ
jgi:hypothetical protein